MRALHLRAVAFAIGFVLAVAAAIGAIAAPAMAVGAEVYRTDNDGYKSGTVTGFGNTSPDCCCVWHGNGYVGYGVRVCYMP